MKVKNKLVNLSLCAVLFFTGCLCFGADSKPPETKNSKPQVQTLLPSKKEKKHVLAKFMHSMLWVLMSCAVIWGVLILYKNRKAKEDSAQPLKDISQDLDSPSTVEDAMNFVIKKF